MSLRTLAIGALAATALAAGAVLAQDEEPAGLTTLDGVFSAEQAERGREVYNAECAGCHGANLRGGEGNPSIAGVGFNVSWGNRTLGDLFTYVHDFMPAGAPGSLSDQQYVDVIAYMLERNNFPPSEDGELPSDIEALDAIVIVIE